MAYKPLFKRNVLYKVVDTVIIRSYSDWIDRKVGYYWRRNQGPLVNFQELGFGKCWSVLKITYA